MEEVYRLKREELNELARAAGKAGGEAGVRAYKEEQKKVQRERTDKRLRNTKLLLRNYRALKDNSENSVFGRTQIGESAADILESMMNMYDNDVIVDSIKRSASRTAIIVMHIETMLSLYEAYCEKSKDAVEKRRYKIIFNYYFTEIKSPPRELAKKYNTTENTVYRDINSGIEKLSALIFGIDGLEKKG